MICSPPLLQEEKIGVGDGGWGEGNGGDERSVVGGMRWRRGKKVNERKMRMMGVDEGQGIWEGQR